MGDCGHIPSKPPLSRREKLAHFAFAAEQLKHSLAFALDDKKPFIGSLLGRRRAEKGGGEAILIIPSLPVSA